MLQPFCLRRFKKLCLFTANLVLSMRLAMHIKKKTKLFKSPETKWLLRGKGLFLNLLVVMYTGWDEIFSGLYCSDVEKIVSSLSRNKRSGLDKIPTRVIKDFVPVIIISFYRCDYKFFFYHQHLYPRSVTNLERGRF